MKKSLYEKTKEKLKELTEAWGKADIFLVGGCVRDSKMGVGVKDIDILINIEDGPNLFCNWLKSERKAKNFVTYPRFGTAKFDLTVNDVEVPIECVMPRTETYKAGPRKPDSIEFAAELKIDARRRDFCCNALYENIVTGELQDPTGHGLEDIENKILRTPVDAEQTFKDDPLRMLRAFRFSAEKGFTISPSVYEKIKPYPEYCLLSMERVNSEFVRILKTSAASKIIRQLHETGLLRYIVPELEEGWGFNQNSHYHSLNLSDHSLAVLDGIKTVKNEKTRMAALLHDISKYRKFSVKTNGEFSFKGHAEDSAEMAGQILKRLKWSGDDIKIVEKLILNHMKLKRFRDPVTGLYNGSDRITRRIVREFGEELRPCLELIDADNKAHAPAYNMPSQVTSFMVALDTLKKFPIIRSCPVSGDDIMSEFGLKPGPVIKEIKEIMLDMLDENPDLTKEELLEKYKAEFDGHFLWAHKEGAGPGRLGITEGEPIRDVDGYFKIIPYEYPFYIEDSAVKFDEGEWRKKIESIKYPKIYSAFTRTKKAREIFDQAANVLVGIKGLDGFKSVTMRYDDYGDLSGEIEWYDMKPDFIL